MIDSHIVGHLTPDLRMAVASAILTIANSGIVEMQRADNMERILSGPADEPVDILANRILEHRKSQYALDAFMTLASQMKDLTDA